MNAGNSIRKKLFVSPMVLSQRSIACVLGAAILALQAFDVITARHSCKLHWQEVRQVIGSAAARWIQAFFTETLAQIPTKTMILDWYHLARKCLEASSRICRGKVARAQFLRRLYRRLWRGKVAAAMAFLEAYRPQAKNEALLEVLIAYLHAREAWIPNYRQRRINQLNKQSDV